MTLRLDAVCKSFGATDVVKSVSLETEPGEFVAFVGPSGCGKSTMLRMIAGLEKVTSGSISIAGRDVTQLPSSQRGIAMVFQSYALYPHLSVYDNIAFSLQIAKLPKAEIRAKVLAAADSLQLTQLLDRLPKELSGGQRQRVAIGRAIVRSPQVFLFDEPLSNLDAALRTDMRAELAALHERLQATMIYVTHDQVEAMTLAHRIVVMNAGHVEQIGRPMELYLKPQTPFVAGFIGSPKMNFIEGALAQQFGADLLGIRPEDVLLHEQSDASAGERLSCTVDRIEQLGADTLIYTHTQEHGHILVRHASDFTTSVGRALPLVLPHAKLHAFRKGQRLAS